MKRDRGLRFSEAEARARFGDDFVDAALGLRTSVRIDAAKPERPRGKFSNAKPTARVWPDGDLVTFPSKMEAHVFDRLAREVAAVPGARLYRQVPLPLLSIAPNARGVPYVLRVDFAVVAPGRPVRYVEAKGKRKSREWMRGAAAARAAGYPIEEVDR